MLSPLEATSFKSTSWFLNSDKRPCSFLSLGLTNNLKEPWPKLSNRFVFVGVEDFFSGSESLSVNLFL